MIWSLAFVGVASAVVVAGWSRTLLRSSLTIASPMVALAVGHVAFMVYPSFAFVRGGIRTEASTMLLAALLSTAILAILLATARRPTWSSYAKEASFEARSAELPREQQDRALRLSVLLSVLNLFALLMMYRSAGTWPLLDILQGGSAIDIRDARFSVTRGQNIIVALAPVTFSPLVVAIARLTGGRHGRSWRYYRIGSVVLAAVVATFPGNKLPFAILLVVWYVAGQFGPAASKDRGFSRRAGATLLLAVGIAAYAIFVFRGLGVATGGLLETLTEDIIGRATRDPANSSYAAFENYPKLLPYTYFSDINELAYIRGVTWRNLSRESAAVLTQNAATNAPPSTIGRFYAQLGMPIVVAGWTAVVIVFLSIENSLIRNGRLATITGRLWWVMMTIGGIKVSIGDAYQVFTTDTLGPLICCTLLMNLGSRRHRRDRMHPSPTARNSDAYVEPS